MALKDKILALFKRLLPNGQAYTPATGGVMEATFKGIIGDDSTASSLVQVRDDGLNVLQALIPDNSGFSTQDAHDWYRRLGLYDTGSISFSAMKAAILQKMSWAANPTNQQTAAYIQSQLHAAGFTDCNVFFNNLGSGGSAISIGAVTGEPIEIAMCGLIQCNDTQCGTPAQTSGTGETYRKVANYIEETKDDFIILGNPNYEATFFIAQAVSLGSWTNANVSLSQKQQLRQLIIKLKSQQMVCWLMANYL